MMPLLAFLLSVALISLSGVMMPGPVFAVTVARGQRSPYAGALVAVGHGIIEFPLMFLVYYGFAGFLKQQTVQAVIGIVGGLMLVWMGYGMIRSGQQQTTTTDGSVRLGPVAAGLAATGANPYFFLWWATVGALLISRSLAFGLIGFLLFAVTHWLCDLGWDTLVSFVTYRSRRLWTPLVHRVVFTTCGLMLAGFGVYFALSAWG
ncbi:MAG: LysE family transporter [Anaerolineae bacterium]|nr:LysE family transporter [Anaerolineae bacterium]